MATITYTATSDSITFSLEPTEAIPGKNPALSALYYIDGSLAGSTEGVYDTPIITTVTGLTPGTTYAVDWVFLADNAVIGQGTTTATTEAAPVPYSLSIGTITDTSVQLTLTLGESFSSSTSLLLSALVGSSGMSAATTIPAGSVAGDQITATVNGLTPSQTYSSDARFTSPTTGSKVVTGPSFTTRSTTYNDPRTATEWQWEDLADRVQSKAEIGTVLSTPSSTAYVGTNNIAANAVTTAKIADSAVTASKIDFVSSNFPVAETDAVVGYSATVHLARVANMVFASSGTQVKNFQSAHTRSALSETIPSGYRPATTGFMVAPCQDFGATNAQVSWEIDSNGAMFLSNSSGNNTRINIGGCWVTNDDWPS